MDKIEITSLNNISKILGNINSKLAILNYSTPLHEDKIKKEFLKTHKLRFEYRKSDVDFDNIETTLNNIEVPQSILRAQYFKLIKETMYRLRIMQNIGNGALVQKYSSLIFGTPSQKTVRFAENIMGCFSSEVEQKTESSDTLKKEIENALDVLGIFDWKVRFSQKLLTTVYLGEKCITVGKSRKVSKVELQRIINHEVFCHVVRSYNGSFQPLTIFRTGFAFYDTTEEGITTFIENKTNTLTNFRIRSLALRVLAVQSVLKQCAFEETFNNLKEFGASRDEAWSAVFRAYRGGGLVKDHIYLEGFSQLNAFVKKTGPKHLLIGKIGINDVGLVKKLLSKEILNPPKIIPPVIRNTLDKLL